MKTRKALLMALPLVAAIAFSSPSHALFNKETKVEWSDVPAAVQKAITAHSDGGKVDEVEKEAHGKTEIYEAKVNTSDDGALKLKVTDAGKLVGLHYKSKSDEDIAWDKLPNAVQKTINTYAEGGKTDKVEKETTENGALYEAKIKSANDRTIQLKVSEDGKLRELETKKDWF